MARPTKQTLIDHLRHNVEQLTGTVKLWVGKPGAKETLERVDAIVGILEKLADKIEQSPATHAEPITANVIYELSTRIEEVANGSPDKRLGEQLSVTANGMTLFMQRHTPILTTQGWQFDDRPAIK